MSTYTPGYPPDGSSLGQTKSVIRDNLDTTFQTLGIDHINNNGDPGGKPKGYHTIIHEVPQTTVNTVAGYNQVFCGVPGTLVVDGTTTPAIPNDGNTQLYSLNSSMGLHQLTGASLGGTNGYAWTGGLLLQWGYITPLVNGTTGTVNFPVSFTTSGNILSLQMTLVAKAGGTTAEHTIAPIAGSITKSGFKYNFNGTTSYTASYWFALGY